MMFETASAVPAMMVIATRATPAVFTVRDIQFTPLRLASRHSLATKPRGSVCGGGMHFAALARNGQSSCAEDCLKIGSSCNSKQTKILEAMRRYNPDHLVGPCQAHFSSRATFWTRPAMSCVGES